MMNNYLEKHAFCDGYIATTPKDNLKIVVVIPCFKESDILSSLQSLIDCDAVPFNIEIIVVVNHSEIDEDEIKTFNQKTVNEIEQFASMVDRDDLTIFVVKAFDLPKKHAGVGLARKIGMDEALRRFAISDISNGIICAFDADATCKPNYFVEVLNYFDTHPKHWGCAIYYEHPLEGLSKESMEYKAIYEYELHLRYHIQFLKLINYPFSNHTVGSSMAVTANGYALLGGMNKRKAGEDFYFLHKFSVINRLGELNSTTIYPSPRSSDRVPFGTGRAVGQLLETKENLKTYHPNAFFVIGEMITILSKTSSIDLQLLENQYLKDFLISIGFVEKLKEIRKNTTTKAAFVQRFYRFFNPFIFMKWLHYYRDKSQENIDVYEASKALLGSLNISHENKDLLDIYRKLDRKSRG